jgi:hypothetical protein
MGYATKPKLFFAKESPLKKVLTITPMSYRYLKGYRLFESLIVHKTKA